MSELRETRATEFPHSSDGGNSSSRPKVLPCGRHGSLPPQVAIFAEGARHFVRLFKVANCSIPARRIRCVLIRKVTSRWPPTRRGRSKQIYERWAAGAAGLADPAGRGPLVAAGLVPDVQMVIITSTHLTGRATRHLVKAYGRMAATCSVSCRPCARTPGRRRSPDLLFLFSAKGHG